MNSLFQPYKQLHHPVWGINAQGEPCFYNDYWTNHCLQPNTQYSTEFLPNGIFYEDCDKLLETIKDASRNYCAFEVHFRLWHEADKNFQWAFCNATPLFDNKQNYLGHVGVCMFLPDQQRFLDYVTTSSDRAFELTNKVLLNLTMQKEQLQLIFDHLPARIWFKDSNNIILRANQAAANSVGLEPHQVENIHTKEIFHDKADEYHQEDLEIIESGSPHFNKVEAIEQEGEKTTWVRTDKIPYVDAETGNHSVIIISQDITEQRQDEIFLANIYRISAGILGNTEGGIKAILQETADYLGMELGLATENHEQHYKILSVTDNTLDIEKNDIFRTEKSLSEVIFDTAKVKAWSKPGKFLGTITHCYPHLKVKSAIGCRVDVNQHLYGTVIFTSSQTRSKAFTTKQKTILRIISEFIGSKLALQQHIKTIKTSEANLSHLVNDLTRSNEELEHFAYTASHDLQEPLRLITNFASLLKNKYSEKLDDKGVMYVDHAVTAAKRMQTLITELLDYAKQGEDAGKIEKVDCEKLVSYIKWNLTDSIRSSNAVITSSELPEIWTNPLRLSRVLQNLLSNAIKYHHDSVEPQIHIDVKTIKEAWLFSVKDNGIGIDKDYHQHIFMPFKRLNNQEQFSGTGLGLAACKKLIESIGGSIWVESKLNQGSTFFFTVPKRFKNKA